MNTAALIHFPKPQEKIQEARNMYSDKFAQGYVMSSRLYRKEVWPFLSDAARNVYAELEDRINGHNKESDFVSWTQLQGGDLKDSRKLSLSTVKVGLAMLLANRVVSIVATGKQGIKKYRLNEVSLAGKAVIKPTEKESSKYFGNRSTTETEVLRKPKQNTSETGAPTTSETEDTIDSPIDLLDNNDNTAPEKFEPQNRPLLQFIEYHPDNQKAFKLRELTQVYPVQSDFIAQAKISFPKLTDDQIHDEIKKLAQWSVTAEKRQSQKWMTTWLNWLKNFEDSQSKPKPAAKPNQPKAEKPQRSSRFGQYLKNNSQQPQQMRDLQGESHDV